MDMPGFEREWYMGIDPGNSGAIVVVNKDAQFMAGIKCSNTEHDVAEFVRDYSEVKGCFIEKVHSMPKQGVSSTFKFGMSYGFLRGLLVAYSIPFREVTPRMWQKSIGILQIKSDTNTQKKNRHKAKAQQLYPSLKITHAVADALLIARYARDHWS